VRVDGRPFADTVTSLTPTPPPTPPVVYYPPVIDENGTDRSLSTMKEAYVTTGTQSDGTVYVPSSYTTCDDWQSSATTGYAMGGSDTTGSTSWTQYTSIGCTSIAPLYCFGVNGSFTTVPAMVALPAQHRFAFPLNLSKASFAPSHGRSPASTANTADALCQADGAASFATLCPANTCTYRAFMAASGTPAADAARFSSTGAPWFRPDGTQIVASASDLFTSAPRLLAPINQYAQGTYLNYADEAIVGGTADPTAPGTMANTCNNWTSSDAAQAVQVGELYFSGRFLNGYNQNCGTSTHVICLQQ
jgi:hypothetical protein